MANRKYEVSIQFYADAASERYVEVQTIDGPDPDAACAVAIGWARSVAPQGVDVRVIRCVVLPAGNSLVEA